MKISKNYHKGLMAILVVLNITFLIQFFRSPNQVQKFEEIDVERINIVEAVGTLKFAIFNSARGTRGLDGDKRQGTGTITGVLFYNEKGYEAGDLVFHGKKIAGGQDVVIG